MQPWKVVIKSKAKELVNNFKICILIMFIVFMFILMFIMLILMFYVYSYIYSLGQRNNSNLSHLKLNLSSELKITEISVMRVENSIPNMVFYFRHFETKLMFILSLMINVDRMNKELSSKII